MIVTVDRDRHSRFAWLGSGRLLGRSRSGPPMAMSASCRSRLDRSWAVFTFYPPSDRKRSDIWRVELGGRRRPSRLSGTAGFQERGAAISPDGSTIAFVSEQPGWNQVHLMAADGSGRRQLTEDQGNFSQLAWHPDGGSLAGDQAQQPGFATWSRSMAPSGEVAVIGVGGWWSDPAWTADGALVALHEDQRTPPRIVRIDRDGSSRHTAATSACGGDGCALRRP